MAWLKALPLLVFPILLLCGCRKDQDETGPSVSIVSPPGSHTIYVPDTIKVIVDVRDDNVVRTVRIALNDANGVPIVPTIVEHIDAPSVTIDRSLIVNSETIISDAYTIAIQASDGDNTTSAFRTIYIQGTPLRTRALYVVPASGGDIIKIDSVGVQSVVTSLSPVTAAEVNSHTASLYLAGDLFAPLQIIPTDGQHSIGQIPNQNAQEIPYFTHVHTDRSDDRTYVSTNDGRIRGYKGSTSPVFTAEALVDHRPYATVIAGNRLVAEQVMLGTMLRKLVIYGYGSGVILDQQPIDVVVEEMFARTPQQILVFGNRDGNGVIQSRNVNSGGVFEMRVFNDTPIRAVSRINMNEYALALEDQVVRWTYTDNSASPLLSTACSDVAYDEANGILYAGTQQQILVVDPMLGNLVNTITVPVEVGGLLPLYNR